MRVKQIMAVAIIIIVTLIRPTPIATAVPLKEPQTIIPDISPSLIKSELKRVYDEYQEREERLKREQEERIAKEKADKDILYKICAAEAGYGDKDAIKNVVYIIFNRINHDGFPNTVEDVVFEKRQFTPTADGRYWTVEVTDEIIEAVDEAYSDYADSNKAKSAIFFKSMHSNANWSNYEFLFSDGKHNFYKKRNE